MSLSPELEKLQALSGKAVPDKTVLYSRPTRQGEPARRYDTVAQITKIAVAGTPKGDHYFRLGLPDKPNDPRGAIEVDDTQEGDPSLKIVASGIFEEEPDVLGTMVSVGLTESGVGRAIVESRFTNLSPDFLQRAGGQVIEAANAGEGSDDPAIAFYPLPPSEINDRAMAA